MTAPPGGGAVGPQPPAGALARLHRLAASRRASCAPPEQGTYSITVNPPLPLQVVLPASGSTLSPGTEGVAYAQNFFVSGGVAPYAWSKVSGQFPPGLALRSTNAPDDNNNQLAGTPTQAGKFTFTMKVTDRSGQSASQQFELTIKDQGGGGGGGQQ